MADKNRIVLPVLAAITAIPQLLFWWLAPASAAAHMPVFIGGTLLTIGIAAAYFATYCNSDLRKTAGLAVVSLILDATIVIIAALLLANNASARSAVFALAIVAMACLIVLVPMIHSVLKAQITGVHPANIPMYPNHHVSSDAPDREIGAAHAQPRNPAPSCVRQRPSPAVRPLPPRNR